VNVEEEAALINANLDHVLDSLQQDVDATYTTDPAAILCTTRTQFVQYAWLHLHCGNTDWVTSNYACLAAALLRLLDLRKQVAELEDAVAMRDSVIRSLGEIEEL
jgi:hypothetical protein